MANKRMFNLSIVDSDAFLDLPLTAQALYFHLAMRADDDGFIGNPNRIKKLTGACDSDLKELIDKRFVLMFEDGVAVIKHWKMHNTIQSDRYKKTNYTEDLKKLRIKENNAYTLTDRCTSVSEKEQEKPCIQNGNIMETECIQNGNTDKIRLDKIRLDKKRESKRENAKAKSTDFVPPTLKEINSYVESYLLKEQMTGFDFETEYFIEYYSKRNWYQGRQLMIDWKKTVRDWIKSDRTYKSSKKRTATLPLYMSETNTTDNTKASAEAIADAKKLIQEMRG